MEELSSEHHLQLQKQEQDFEQTRERILKEKEEIEAEKSDLLQDLNLAYDAQVMTEKRRRQMENELATCQVALEKESNEKAELEQKITSVRLHPNPICSSYNFSCVRAKRPRSKNC